MKELHRYMHYPSPWIINPRVSCVSFSEKSVKKMLDAAIRCAIGSRGTQACPDVGEVFCSLYRSNSPSSHSCLAGEWGPEKPWSPKKENWISPFCHNKHKFRNFPSMCARSLQDRSCLLKLSLKQAWRAEQPLSPLFLISAEWKAPRCDTPHNYHLQWYYHGGVYSPWHWLHQGLWLRGAAG